MAASDALPVPKKNTAWRMYFAIRKNDGTLITSWTGADSEVSLDGGSFADCTNEATEIGTTGCGYIDFTAGEMNADGVVYKLTVTNTSALPLVVTLFPEEAGDYRVADTQKVDLNTIKTQSVTCSGGVTVPAATLASTTNITAGTITTTTNLTNLPSIPANWLTAAGIASGALDDKGNWLKPTVAGRTLDVSVGGEAGIDWANVGSPTTTVGLSGTTIASSQVVASVTGAVGSVTGNVGGNVTGSVGSVIAAVGITSNVKKNQALASFEFMMTDSTNHLPATGKTVTVTRSIDGGAFGSGTLSAVTEVANGIYRVDFGSGDLNGNVITLRATATACDDTFERIVTQP